MIKQMKLMYQSLALLASQKQSQEQDSCETPIPGGNSFLLQKPENKKAQTWTSSWQNGNSFVLFVSKTMQLSCKSRRFSFQDHFGVDAGEPKKPCSGGLCQMSRQKKPGVMSLPGENSCLTSRPCICISLSWVMWNAAGVPATPMVALKGPLDSDPHRLSFCDPLQIPSYCTLLFLQCACLFPEVRHLLG